MVTTSAECNSAAVQKRAVRGLRGSCERGSVCRLPLSESASELGREYDLLIAGERVKTGDLLKSVNPSNPEQVVGFHHKATADLARKASRDGARPLRGLEERSGPGPRRACYYVLRRSFDERKFEFNAWLAFEAGKTWPEAEAETAEAIDFCEYYARQMLRFLPSEAPCSVAGREGSAHVPAAGCRRDHSALEFRPRNSCWDDDCGARNRKHGRREAFERYADHRAEVCRGASGSRLSAFQLLAADR